MTLEEIPFNLTEVVEGAMQLFGKKAQEKNLELFCWIYHDVPSHLLGDPTRLRQILINLIGNAIKFTEKGEVILRVSKSYETSSSASLHFSIDDTGIGIPPEAKRNLFKPFSQADGSTTRRFGGTGLGLAISKHLVQLMSGRIGCESRVGKGSSFWFSITLPKSSELTHSYLGDVDKHKLSELLVLVVDDSLAVQNTLLHMLEPLKIRTLVASSANEGLEFLKRQASLNDPVDVAIVDYRMPMKNGLELCREIQMEPSIQHLHCIMLTAYSIQQ